MAWILTELLDKDAPNDAFTDAELMALYTAIRERIKTPYDDVGPAFTAYTKLNNHIKGTRKISPCNETRLHDCVS